MPLVSYRASAEPVLHKIREVAGHRQSAEQLLKSSNRSAIVSRRTCNGKRSTCRRTFNVDSAGRSWTRSGGGGRQTAAGGRLLLHLQNSNEERRSYGMKLSYGSPYFPSLSPSSSLIDRIGE
jgi:hypothetical protein